MKAYEKKLQYYVVNYEVAVEKLRIEKNHSIKNYSTIKEVLYNKQKIKKILKDIFKNNKKIYCTMIFCIIQDIKDIGIKKLFEKLEQEYYNSNLPF